MLLACPEHEPLVARIQAQVEQDWRTLLERCGDRVPAGLGYSPQPASGVRAGLTQL